MRGTVFWMEKCFQNSLTSFTSKLIKRIREIRMRNFDYSYVKHIFRLHSNRIPYSIVTIITLSPMMFVWKRIQTVHAKGSIINSTSQRGAAPCRQVHSSVREVRYSQLEVRILIFSVVRFIEIDSSTAYRIQLHGYRFRQSNIERSFSWVLQYAIFLWLSDRAWNI